MIRNSRAKTAIAYRTLREAPLPPEANVEITLFANYYGTLEKSNRFNDPSLYTDKPIWTRLKEEIKAMKMFRRDKKHG